MLHAGRSTQMFGPDVLVAGIGRMRRERRRGFSRPVRPYHGELNCRRCALSRCWLRPVQNMWFHLIWLAPCGVSLAPRKAGALFLLCGRPHRGAGWHDGDPVGCAGPINIGNPQEFTIRELAELIIEMTRTKSELALSPCRQMTRDNGSLTSRRRS